jgi:hypothetical protein
LERDEVLIIVSNFSTTLSDLMPHYITFFVKFFFFIESHFKIEIDFKHRKNIMIVIFEMFFELITIINNFKSESGSGNYEKNWYEEFIKLIELFYILLKNYSINIVEDAYFIYRSCGALLKKIVQSYSENINEQQFAMVVFLVFTVLNIVCK